MHSMQGFFFCLLPSCFQTMFQQWCATESRQHRHCCVTTTLLGTPTRGTKRNQPCLGANSAWNTFLLLCLQLLFGSANSPSLYALPLWLYSFSGRKKKTFRNVLWIKLFGSFCSSCSCAGLLCLVQAPRCGLLDFWKEMHAFKVPRVIPETVLPFVWFFVCQHHLQTDTFSFFSVFLTVSRTKIEVN